MFVASSYESNNSYGYVICLDENTANRLYTEQTAEYIVQEVIDNI